MWRGGRYFLAARWLTRISMVSLFVLPLPVWSAVVLSTQTSHNHRQALIDVAAEGTSSSSVISDGGEVAAAGRFMRSEQAQAAHGGASGGAWEHELVQTRATDKEQTVEMEVSMQTPPPTDKCAWANWESWSLCTQTCGGGSRHRARMNTGLSAEFFYFRTAVSSLFSVNFKKKPDVKRIDLVVDYQDTLAKWTGLAHAQNFAGRWTGQLQIDTGGTYVFQLSSHDGATFILEGNVVLHHKGLVTNSDLDPMKVMRGVKVLASDTLYKLEIRYFQGKSGRAGIQWKYKGPDTGNQMIIVPAIQLRHKSTLTACIAGAYERGVVCNDQQCPVDCSWKEWSAYSPCSNSCGGGTQVRTRAIQAYQNYGGAECVGDANFSQTCNERVLCPCRTGDCQLATHHVNVNSR